MPELKPWECFSDPAYYDLWAVRNINDKSFAATLHLHNKDEAEALTAKLNSVDALVRALENVDRLTKRLDLLDEEIKERIAKTAQPTDTQDNDGWIEWRGGKCPIDAQERIEAKFRNRPSEDGYVAAAGSFYWKHDNEDCDMIAYRIIEEPKEQEPCLNISGGCLHAHYHKEEKKEPKKQTLWEYAVQKNPDLTIKDIIPLISEYLEQNK